MKEIINMSDLLAIFDRYDAFFFSVVHTQIWLKMFFLCAIDKVFFHLEGISVNILFYKQNFIIFFKLVFFVM